MWASLIGVLWAAAQLGCGGDPAVPDAATPMEMDARVEGDAFTVPPDAHVVLHECEGLATACSSLDVASCSTVMGCTVTSCRGFAVSCARLLTMTECEAQDGCSWSGSCAGTPRDCATLTETECSSQAGCVMGSRGCSGMATACETLDHTRCLAQPGCMPPPDAGRDAGPPDAAPMPCEPGATPIRVRVLDPSDAPMSGAAVRAAGASCGLGFEETTGSDGVVTFMVDPALGPWSITAARVGYAAISVVDVLGFDFAGDVRLDPITTFSDESYPVSGTLSPVHATSTYVVDTYDFETVTGARESWSSLQYVESPPSPLRFVALELDGAGRALDVAVTPETTRPRAPVTDVALSFGGATPREHAVHVRLPSTGPLSAVTPAYFQPQHVLPTGSYAVVGSVVVSSSTPSEIVFAVRDFDAFPMNFLYTSSMAPTFQLNVFRSGPNADATITIGALTSLELVGASLDGAVVTAAATGWGYVGLHIGETDSQAPRWRVFGVLAADGAPTSIVVPELPSAVTETDLGIDPVTSVLPIAIDTESEPPWMLQTANQGVMGYRATAAGTYVTIETHAR
ncbi:MAG: carboxypeptidase-like regulatory domain-containing protein [Sandaracinaceae bacterium]|nr:carboxypeptidase-like regulatory domain-containing protein [Sandaracinaceae bacterium]